MSIRTSVCCLRTAFISKRRLADSSVRELGTRARPVRSVLYTPGGSRHLDKLKKTHIDGSIIDLEDGVAPAHKARARENVAQALAAGPIPNKTVTVRINSMDSPWGQADLQAVIRMPVNAVCLPKVESAAEVTQVAGYMEEHDAPDDMEIWCLIETPRGVQLVDEIACAHRRVSCLVMGTSDLSRDLHALHTPDRLPLLYSLSKCVLAARANKLQIIDGVHLDMQDSSGFERACRQGKELGFDGKSLIHPKQVPVANWFFGPSAVEVEEAYRVKEAMAAALQRGEATCVLDGQLLEQLHAENAERVIELHEAIQLLEANQANSHFMAAKGAGMADAVA